MKRHTGNPQAPIWLIGDSEPKNQSGSLTEPLDPRHPARHNIWTSILLRLNSELYLRAGRNLDEDQLYVRNAVGSPGLKPAGAALEWCQNTRRAVSWFQKTLATESPVAVFTFGSFAFEFLRRASCYEDPRPFRSWTTSRLGESFRKSVDDFDPSGVNVFPLLHVSIARGHYLTAHRHYTGRARGNYFNYVAKALSGPFMEIPKCSAIWAKAGTQK